MEENPNRRAKYGFVDCSILLFNLPIDISMYVFFKLPVKSILRLRCVCKQWQRLFSDPEFARMHLNHSSNRQKLLLRSYFQSFYSIDYESNCEVARRNFPLKSRRFAQIVGSCNGLLCVAIDHKMGGRLVNYKIVLWNPSMGDYKMLPNANPLIDTNCYLYRHLIGFGYDPFFEDYKMVRFMFCFGDKVDVYSLKTNSWKVIETAPLSRFGSCRNVIGTALNGSIYWLLDDRKMKNPDRWIVGFDLKDDKFIELQLPPIDRDSKYYIVKLTVIGGCLGVYCLYRNAGDTCVILWMMKEDKKDEWTKLAAISTDELRIKSSNFMQSRPLCFFDDEKVLFYITDLGGKTAHVALLVYDPKVNSIVRTIPLHGISRCHNLVTYTESLISPNA